MSRHLRILVLATVFVLACGDSSGPSEPQPGNLAVQFNTSVTTDRALLIQLSGPGAISNVQAANPGVMVFATEAGTLVKVIVTGNLVNGALLRFDVVDVNQVKAYKASIVELSDNTNALRTDLSRHSVSIQK